MLRAIAVALFAVVMGACSWAMYQTGERVAGIPIRSAAALADSAPGTPVTVYGRIAAGGDAKLALFTRSVERCRRVSQERKCSWDEVSRQTPSFQLDLEDAQQPVRIRIINQNYKLEGSMRSIYPRSKEREQGFQNGDQVLVIGVAAATGVQAESVYGGTHELYVRNSRLLALGLAAVAVILLIAAIVMVLRMGS